VLANANCEAQFAVQTKICPNSLSNNKNCYNLVIGIAIEAIHLNFSLTPELERFIQERVYSGLYGSASEVVRDGLRLLREKALLEKTQLVAELNKFIDKGLEDIAAGNTISGDEAYANAKARINKYRKK
jgi:antitoxin ParD1/3/4